MKRELQWVLISVALIWIGCAPTSEVMRADLEKSQYQDAISRGENWLRDASLDAQSTAEGRKIHRLVAEARLAHARVQGKVAVYTAFRDRYAKFSAYEDLLAAAYEEEAKIAFEKDLSTKPTWMQFEWFEKNYAQSSYNPSARTLVLGAEFDRVKAADTMAEWSTFRQRFSDWSEAASTLVQATPWRQHVFGASA